MKNTAIALCFAALSGCTIITTPELEKALPIVETTKVCSAVAERVQTLIEVREKPRACVPLPRLGQAASSLERRLHHETVITMYGVCAGEVAASAE